MATVTRTKTWISGDTLTASDLNAEFNNLLNAAAIVNADISGSAAIVFSKLDSATVAGVTATQTLTNKTLTNPRIDTTDNVAQTYTPAGAGTATLDLSLGSEHRITMPAGNITIALSNDTNAKKFIVSILQDSGGSRTVSWFSTIRWAGGSAPTLTTTGSKRDTFGFIRTGSSTYDGFIIGQNL